MNTLPKCALKNPLEWVNERCDALGVDVTGRHAALRDAEALVPLADRLRQLEERRGRASRAIGTAKERAEDPAHAIAAMRELVGESRGVESELRVGLEALNARFEVLVEAIGASARRASVPAYFAAPAACLEDDGGGGGGSIVAVASTTDAADYSRYVDAHPARTSYHALALRELIAETPGQRSHHLIARAADGTVRGVLPLVRLRSPLFGDFMVSMPWFNYGGPLVDDPAMGDRLIDAAAEMARAQGCSHVEIRETAPRAGMTARTDKVSMTLALPESVAALDEALGSSLRAQSNKATRAGCTYRTGHRELLDDFYQVFSTNMRDLGTPIQNRSFFDGLLELFGDDAFLAIVSKDGRALAAGFLIAHGDTLEIPWASSLRRANALGVNMLLYRRTLGEAIVRGYDHFDFGRSTEGGSTWRFKKQWGAIPRQLYWHYWTADGIAPPGLSPDNPKYRLAIAAWQRMPVALTQRLGPPIARGLP